MPDVDDKALARHLEECYLLKAIETFEPITGGYSTTNHLVVTRAARFFLKQYRTKFSAERVAQIHAVKQFVADGGIPAILPIPNPAGATFFQHDGKQYALFPFVTGKAVAAKEPLSPTALASMAELEAKLHRLSEGGAPRIIREIDLAWDTNDFVEDSTAMLHTIQMQPASAFNEEALKVLALKLQLAEQNRYSFESLNQRNDHLIHGDYHAQNLFFSKDDTVKHLFDFEKAALAPRSYELIRTIFIVILNRGFRSQKMTGLIDEAASYLRRYHSRYPISTDEIHAGVLTRYYTDIHSLWKEREVFEHKNERVKPFFSGELYALTWLSQHLEELIETLQQAVRI